MVCHYFSNQVLFLLAERETETNTQSQQTALREESQLFQILWFSTQIVPT